MKEWILAFFTANGEYMLRVLLAAVLGGVIGLERSRRQKEAGIRTHVIVALGAALFVIISKYGFLDLTGLPDIKIDPTRVASNIVTGVSFLGAGVIFVKNASIRGLTTAAGIWATAGVGSALGAGMYALGVFAALLIIILQGLLHSGLNHLEGQGINQLEMKVRYSQGVTVRLRQQLAEHHMAIEYFRIKKNSESVLSWSLAVRMPRECGNDELLFLLDENPDILELDM